MKLREKKYLSAIIATLRSCELIAKAYIVTRECCELLTSYRGFEGIEIVELGTHQDLLSKGGKYAALVNLGTLNANDGTPE